MTITRMILTSDFALAQNPASAGFFFWRFMPQVSDSLRSADAFCGVSRSSYPAPNGHVIFRISHPCPRNPPARLEHPSDHTHMEICHAAIVPNHVNMAVSGGPQCLCGFGPLIYIYLRRYVYIYSLMRAKVVKLTQIKNPHLQRGTPSFTLTLCFRVYICISL